MSGPQALDALLSSNAGDERAQAMVREVLELHRQAVERMVEAMNRSAPEALDALTREPTVASVLLLHDLHPVPLATRVDRALAALAPAVERGSARLEMLGLEQGILRLRLLRLGDRPIDTLRGAVDDALCEAAPDLVEVSIALVDARPGDLVPAGRLSRKKHDADACDVCGTEIGPEHEHLFEPDSRAISCACSPCSAANVPGKRRVQPRSERVTGAVLGDALWQSLAIPIGLAFFWRNGRSGRVVAAYPGPAGLIESTICDEAWQGLRALHPAVAEMKDDVEALVINRLGGARDLALVSIDEGYRLAGLLRGGSEDAGMVATRFFATLTIRPAREVRS